MAVTLSALRIRNDQGSADTVTLNSNTNWAAASNVDVTILPHPTRAGWLFRIRAEMYSAGGDTFTPRIEIRRELGTWTVPTNYPLQDPSTYAGSTALAYVCTSSQYTDGDPTTNVLAEAVGTFSAGEGAETAVAAAKTLNALEHTEYEWLILIPPFYDVTGTPTQNVPGDRFDLKVTNNGTDFTTSRTIRVTLAQEDGYIGAVSPAKSLRVGPVVDANGNWYTFAEDTQENDKIMALKSTDKGDNWVLVDAGSGPTNTQLNASDVKLDNAGTTIYLLQHTGSAVYIHEFNPSTHSTNADQWGTIDTAVITGLTVAAGGIFCSLEIRSDGDLVAFYNENLIIVSSDRVRYTINTGSGWGQGVTSVDSATSTHYIGPSTVKEIGADIIHIFYNDYTNGVLYHKTLNGSDQLSARDTVSTDPRTTGTGTQVALTNAIAWQSSGNEQVMIGYLEETLSTLKTKLYTNNSPQTPETIAANILDNPSQINSRIPVATLALDPNDQNVGYCYMFFADATSEQLYRESSIDGGAWGSNTLTLTRNIHAARGVGIIGASNYQIGMILEEEGYWGYSGYNGATFYYGFDLDPLPGGDRHIPRGIGRGIMRGVT